MSKLRRVPGATCRLQLNGDFTFDDAAAIVDYLDALGVTDAYLSPGLQARRGSRHGYDVTDPTRWNPELGGQGGLERLAAALRERKMGLLLDIVPNHMALSDENPWLLDVLRHGRTSRWATSFDIDWHPPREELAGRLLLPILGERYADALGQGAIRLRLDPDGLRLHYGDWRLPLRPASRRAVLGPAIAATVAGDDDLVRRCAADADFRARVLARLRRFDGPGGAARLDRLLAAQPYRLAYWATGPREINYRRFFAVSELIAVRVEQGEVFEHAHARILEAVAAGLVTGLRIDHVDGLAEPEAYLRRLAARADVYTVVEKILARDEELPQTWPVDGTTGYDFLNVVNGLFVDPAGFERLRQAWGEPDFATEALDQRRWAADHLFASEFRSLTRQLGALAAREPAARDLTLDELGAALREVSLRLPVYRTYVQTGPASAADRAHLEQALAAAQPSVPGPALAFVGRVLLLERPLSTWRAFTRRWQQYTGALMAKGVEDRALYRFIPLLSVNEVGGDPARPATSVQELHAFLSARRPYAMNTTATHDTKRGEDTRLRIDALSELPHEWLAALRRWRGRGRPALDAADEQLIYQTLIGVWPPDGEPNDDLVMRLSHYLVKAAREAGRHTDWLQADPVYERALTGFVRDLLADPAYRSDFAPLQQRIASFASRTSLAQAVLRVAAPGVPDLYQGADLWDLSLVDPDNRRPVDFARRRSMLRDLDERAARDPAGLARELLARWPDGAIKLYVTACALRTRRRHADLFRDGDYRPVSVVGEHQAHVFAFLRRLAGDAVLVVIPRLLLRLASSLPGGDRGLPPAPRLWGSTALVLPADAPVQWRDAITGRTWQADGHQLGLAQLFSDLPVFLGEREESAAGCR